MQYPFNRVSINKVLTKTYTWDRYIDCTTTTVCWVADTVAGSIECKYFWATTILWKLDNYPGIPGWTCGLHHQYKLSSWVPVILPYSVVEKKKKLQCPWVNQGVVNYASHVKVFGTRIKIQSSDESPFWEPIKWSSNLRTVKIKGSRRHASNLTFDHKNQLIKCFRRDEQAIKHSFCWSKIMIPIANPSIGDMCN